MHARSLLPALLLLAGLGSGCDAGPSPRGACATTDECDPGQRCIASRCMDDPGPVEDAGTPPVVRDAGPRPDVGPPATDGAVPCGESTFEVTETMESVIVPNGVRYMHLKVWGSGGNGEGQCVDANCTCAGVNG